LIEFKKIELLIMNRSYPDINLDNIDQQLVSASLCYLITVHFRGNSENLSSEVIHHLKILIELNEFVSPEATATYHKLKKVWANIENEGKIQPKTECSCKKTIH
jgi:hypothetical protein